MIGKIKRVIKDKLSRPFINYIHDDFSERLVENECNLYATSYGELNPDKLFYVIWRVGGGAGFFSNFVHVLAHIKIAESLGMLAVVDFEKFKTFYNEEHAINFTENAWEYYFKQPTGFSLKEVYQSKHVFICNGEFPLRIWQEELRNKINYKLLFHKYIQLQPDVITLINTYDDIFQNRVLGVHFRGKEMNYARSHPFAPTVSQMFKYTEILLDKYNLKKIFLVTEDKDYLNAFTKRYGERVIHTDSFCISKINAYNIYPRENHKYLLGLEILRDAFLLSKCNGMLCSESNVSEFARMMGNHEVVYKIDNGLNSPNFILARYLYEIKKRLPSYLGGMKEQIIVFDDT